MGGARDDGLVIRRATDDDVGLLLALSREVQALHAAAEPGWFKPIVMETAPFAAMVADPDGRVLIAESGGEAAGYCYVKIVRRPESPFGYAATTVHIDQLAVLGAHQGAGIGTALIDWAEALAAGSGANRLTLDVWSFNTAARRFYARRGFAPMQERLGRVVAGRHQTVAGAGCPEV